MPRFEDIRVERGTTPSVTKQFGFSDNPTPRNLTGYTGTLEVFADAYSTVPLFPSKSGTVLTDPTSMQWVMTAGDTDHRPGYYSSRITLTTDIGKVERWHGWFIIDGA